MMEQFKTWLIVNGISVGTVNSYCAGLRRISEDLNENIETIVDKPRLHQLCEIYGPAGPKRDIGKKYKGAAIAALKKWRDFNSTETIPSNFDKLCRYLHEAGESAKIKPSETSDYRSFIGHFPPNRLTLLSLEEYCMGTGNNTSLSWWLERGLAPVLGRYMPGSAKGHIIYFKSDGSLYKHNALKNLTDEAALEYTLKIQASIANADINSDLSWIDDDTQVYHRAGLDAKTTIGDGRKLRLLTVYNPDEFLPISSSEHLAYFLALFDTNAEAIPPKNQAVARSLLLRKVFLRAQQAVPGITTYGFMRALYDTDLRPPKNAGTSSINGDADNAAQATLISKSPLNQILFGPPGTGKTYSTVNAALEILDTKFLASNKGNRTALKNRFDEFVKHQHIRFITFHQSFSYEDFVEGLSAETFDGRIHYDVKSGVFKELCEAATAKLVKKETVNFDVANRRIWKMSLGNTLGADAYIFDEAIAENRILLGYGWCIDFTGCRSRKDVHNVFIQSGSDNVRHDSYDVTAVTAFVSKMQIGDLVVISDGNHKFRAIGEITGDYQVLNRDEQDDSYGQSRSVRWLRVYQPSLPRDRLLNNAFSQATIYQLHNHAVDRGKLAALLNDSEEACGTAPNTNPYVLIIDEINRGNIAKIFGELITLIEPSKRAEATEALTVTLPYSKDTFSVPSNVYLIGTMNTSDRSLSGLDIALRRRFVFKEMPPKPELLADIDIDGINIGALLQVMNQRIEILLGRDYCLGHAYFMPLLEDPTLHTLSDVFKKQILPLLQEYFFDDWQRIQWVLNDHRKTSNQFLTQQSSIELSNLLGDDVSISDHQLPWQINDDAFTSVEAYRGILQVKM